MIENYSVDIQFHHVTLNTASVVCSSSVGRGLQPEVDVIVVCIHFG